MLRTLAPRYGLRYSSYERDGYGRLTLSNVVYTNERATFKAERLEALQPTTWLWLRNFETNQPGPNFLQVKGWELDLPKQTEPERRNATGSVYDVLQGLAHGFGAIESWLPKALLDQGTIRFAGKEVRLLSVEWNKGTLSSRIATDYNQNVSLTANLSTNFPWTISAKIDPAGLDSKIILSQDPASAKIESAFFWRSNVIEATARFDKEGWLPSQAMVRAESFRVQASEIKLDG